MCNNKINLVIYRGILCGFIGLSNMVFGMDKIILQKSINVVGNSCILRKKNKSPHWLDHLHNGKVDIVEMTGRSFSLNDLIEGVLVKEEPGKYHFLASAIFIEDVNVAKILYTDPKHKFHLQGFADEAFEELTNLAKKNEFVELLIPDPSGTQSNSKSCFNDRFFNITQVIDNSKKGILFYCGLGVSAFVFIGAILFYLGKLPQF